LKDLLRINGMSFYGYHGVSTAEKETGRLFEVDCEIELSLAEAGHSDHIQDTVDYSEVYHVIRKVVEGRAFALVEALATELATKILDNFPIYRVTLKVRKVHPPLGGQVRHIEVEVTRFQGDTTKLTEQET